MKTRLFLVTDILVPRSRTWESVRLLSMIVVMTGRRASHLLTKREGIGSSGQDFNVELWISDLTLLADRILNADNNGVDRLKPSAVVNAEAGKSIISASICLWIVSIFDTVYFPTSLAKVGAWRFGGNSSPCDWLLARNNFRWLQLLSSISLV